MHRMNLLVQQSKRSLQRIKKDRRLLSEQVTEGSLRTITRGETIWR
jgi:hypothetical protein